MDSAPGHIDEIRVEPKRFPLDGTHTVWESILYDRGWNRLPQEQRYGIIKVGYGDLIDVEFPALNITLNGIFIDEVFRLPDAEDAQAEKKTPQGCVEVIGAGVPAGKAGACEVDSRFDSEIKREVYGKQGGR